MANADQWMIAISNWLATCSLPFYCIPLLFIVILSSFSNFIFLSHFVIFYVVYIFEFSTDRQIFSNIQYVLSFRVILYMILCIHAYLSRLGTMLYCTSLVNAHT